jgi:hypothetical protein
MNMPQPAPAAEELDDYVAEMTRSRRRRLLIGGGVAALAVGAVVTVIALNVPRTHVDPALVSKIRGALPNISPSERPAFAGAALAELEAKRLPAPLIKALGEIQSMPPEYATMSLARPLASPEALSLWQHACPAGPRALAESAMSDRSSAVDSFCSACPAACARLKPTPSGHVAAVAFAAVAADELARQGDLDPLELELLRMIAD